jgi:hypothetical protein
MTKSLPRFPAPAASWEYSVCNINLLTATENGFEKFGHSPFWLPEIRVCGVNLAILLAILSLSICYADVSVSWRDVITTFKQHRKSRTLQYLPRNELLRTLPAPLPLQSCGSTFKSSLRFMRDK